MSKTQEEFSNYLARYIMIKPSKLNMLAERYRIDASVVSKWADGRLKPSEYTINLVFNLFKKVVSADLQRSVAMYVCLNTDGAKKLATKFEVSLPTVARWACGIANPHIGREMQILEFIGR